MFIEIKSWLTGGVLFAVETENMRLAIKAAIDKSVSLSYADLRSADLSSANLRSADLRYANLSSADLRSANPRGSMILDTGETWKRYLTETVPELLIAGGKPLDSFGEHFACHEWANCPMAHAFDTHDMTGVPRLLQPRAEQFIRLFDAGKIPWPLPTAEQINAEDAQFDAEFDANRAEATK